MNLNGEQKKAFKRLGYMLVASIVMSAYIAGVIETLISGYGFTYNPIGVIKCMALNGFPTGGFVFFFVALVGTGGYAFLHMMKNAKGMDKMGRLFKLSVDRKGYGDTHFEEPDEYVNAATIQTPKDAFGTIFGQLDDSGKHLINFRMDKNNRLNQHTAIVGSSGSGKTYTYSKPFIFQAAKRRESIILTDPDGGLYRDTAGYLIDKGYVVRRFDLSNLYKSDGWHCLNSIKGDELNAQLFAQTVIANLVEDTGSIYGAGPMSLLKALILRVVLGHDFPPERKNIQSVYELLQNPAGEEFLDMMFDAASLPPAERPCLGPYLAFKQGSNNLRGNLITNLSVQLQLFQNELVCKVLSSDDIDLELPAKQPCAYYCIFPDSHDAYKFIVSLFFSMLFITLISFADKQPNGRCPIPVNFLLDEFPSIGVLPDFDRKMATIRKRAMNVSMIFQDITQLQNNYKDTWVTLLSNCSTFLSLGINDEFTSNMVTKRIGETTIEVQTQQHDAMESIFTVFHKRSTGEGKRALLSYDELFKLSENDSIILFQWHNPIWCKKYPYALHPEAKKLRTILPTEIPDITDTEARRAKREKEDEYITKYLRDYPLDDIDRSYAGLCEPQIEPSYFDTLKEEVIKQIKLFKKKARKKITDPPEKKRVLGMDVVPCAAHEPEPEIEFCDEIIIVSPCEPTDSPPPATESEPAYKVDPETGEILEEYPKRDSIASIEPVDDLKPDDPISPQEEPAEPANTVVSESPVCDENPPVDSTEPQIQKPAQEARQRPPQRSQPGTHQPSTQRYAQPSITFGPTVIQSDSEFSNVLPPKKKM